MKQKYICAWCGREIYRYPSQVKDRKMLFCSRQCLAEYRSKKYNSEDRPIHKRPDLAEYNERHNSERMTLAVRTKLRNARLGSGVKNGYSKLYGRAEHRVIAERLLGRPLKPGEVVHHIDRNKRNNSPENLMVFSSQAEHARWHKEHDTEGGDAR